jgi:hypothetical protein
MATAKHKVIDSTLVKSQTKHSTQQLLKKEVDMCGACNNPFEPFENVKSKSAESAGGCCSKKNAAPQEPNQADAPEVTSTDNVASKVHSKTDRSRPRKNPMTWGEYLSSLKDEEYIKLRKISK